MRCGAVLFLLFLVLDIVGIAMFTSGFFLTRFEVTNINTCDPKQQGLQELVSRQLQTSNSHCWTGPKFEKIVWITIDALRFEFAYQNDRTNNGSINEYYHNKFKLITDLLQAPESRDHCLLYQFIADSPTVTMQRIKALTTGSIPTFIDINDVKFESATIKEDNLIDQWKKSNRSLVMMGDDTWTQLFPTQFTKALDYPSFNAKDLHTVDNGVIDHLMDEMNKFDILIAHFLGVDHVGHRYGPNHPAMAAKLNQLDQVLREVVESLSEDTLFIILGDHGMTEDGNHGGATDEETHSTLFMYSKGKNLSHYGDSLPKEFPSVHQIDLVPTLSLLTGIPIPFGNLGAIIPDLFSISDSTQSCSNTDATQLFDLLLAYQLNARQVSSYLLFYSSISSQFPGYIIEEHISHFTRLASEVDDFLSRSNSIATVDVSVLCNFAKEYEITLHEIATMCRGQWAQFDLFSMKVGICLLAVSTTILSLIVLIRLPYKEAYIPSLSNGSSGKGACFLLSLWMIFAAVVHGAGQFSNSYIEMNEKVVSFLLCGLFVLYLLPSIVRKQFFTHEQVIVALLLFLVRLMSEGWFSGRHEGFISHENLIEIGKEIFFLAVPLFVGTLALHRFIFFRFNQKWLRYSQLVQVVAIGSFWLLQSYYDKEQGYVPLFSLLLALLPRSVYFISALHILFILADPKRSELLAFHSILGLSMECIDGQVAGFFLNILISLWSILALISGPGGTIALLCFFAQLFLFLQLTKRYHHNRFVSQAEALCLSLMTTQYFFATGHHWQLSSLQFETAFIGFEEFNWLAGFILMVLNTFSAPILVVFSIPLFVGTRFSNPATFSYYNEAFFSYKMFFSWNLLLTLIFVYTERRHLMVWRVFAPKFLIESCLLLFIDIMLLLCSVTINWARCSD